MYFNDLNILALAKRAGQLRHQWGFELDHPTAPDASEVIMGGGLGRLKMAVILAQTMFLHQSGFFEKRQGAINGGKADPGVARPGQTVQSYSVQMLLVFVQDFQNQQALAGHLATVDAKR